MTIKTFPAVNISLFNKASDKFDSSFIVLDDNGATINFYSGYTSAYFTIYTIPDNTKVFQFSTTGATNTIDMSNSVNGVIRVVSPALAVTTGEYLYDLVVKNATSQLTIMYGTFTAI